MPTKLALSLAVSALILAIGGFFAAFSRLQGVEDRLVGIQQALDAPARAAPKPPPPKAAPPTSSGTEEKLAWIVEKLQQMEDDAYGYQIENGKEFYDLQTALRQVKSMQQRIVSALSEGAGARLDIGWGLVPPDAPLTPEVREAYRKEAEKFGIQVEDGVVRVRGLLNFSPKVEMPIEYFVTRYPNAAHETLVHLLGNKDIPPPEVNPYTVLRGLATALYKGMVAAGFHQGMPSHPAPPSPDSDPNHPDWVLATGDVVYIGVRYERDGQEHVALATDWVIDPQTQGPLPVDAFRFTGSARGEDPDTGEPVLAAENLGLLVSVWPNPAALVEVALESSLRNDYTYNFSRIPKAEDDQILWLELIFSKTPIEPKGEGARPIERPETMLESGGR